MPLTKTKLKAWLLVLTASLMPTALMADEPQLILSRFQGAEATPAPAPPAPEDPLAPLPEELLELLPSPPVDSAGSADIAMLGKTANDVTAKYATALANNFIYNS
mgnify:CR=1 FL=1